MAQAAVPSTGTRLCRVR